MEEKRQGSVRKGIESFGEFLQSESPDLNQTSRSISPITRSIVSSDAISIPVESFSKEILRVAHAASPFSPPPQSFRISLRFSLICSALFALAIVGIGYMKLEPSEVIERAASSVVPSSPKGEAASKKKEKTFVPDENDSFAFHAPLPTKQISVPQRPLIEKSKPQGSEVPLKTRGAEIWRVQIGAPRSESQAGNLQQSIREYGYDAVIEPFHQSNDTFYRVLVKVVSRSEGEKLAALVKQDARFPGAFLRPQ